VETKLKLVTRLHDWDEIPSKLDVLRLSFLYLQGRQFTFIRQQVSDREAIQEIGWCSCLQKLWREARQQTGDKEAIQKTNWYNGGKP
jgi:hypothetical protein